MQSLDFEYLESNLGVELTEFQKENLTAIMHDSYKLDSEDIIHSIMEFLGLKYNRRAIIRSFVEYYCF